MWFYVISIKKHFFIILGMEFGTYKMRWPRRGRLNVSYEWKMMPCQNSTTEFVKFWWPQDQQHSPKLSTSGTRPWLVWWLISVKPSLTLKNSLTCWSNVKTRFKLVSRLVWTPKCLQDFLQLCFTLLKNLEAWVCSPWATFWFLKVIWDGPSKLMLVSPISDLAWVMRKINWFQISTGNNLFSILRKKLLFSLPLQYRSTN